jgi:hypothetical protein
MNEDRPKAAPDDLGEEVEAESTGGGGHEQLTRKQRERWSPLTVEGILSRPPQTAQAHDLVMSLGKGMLQDGSFRTPRPDTPDRVILVEVRGVHRKKAQALLGISDWTWGKYRRGWEDARIAHRCADLKRGDVRLFLQPEDRCLAPRCRQTVAPSNVEPLPTATVSVGQSNGSGARSGGYLQRDGKGDGSLEPSEVEGSDVVAVAVPVPQGGSSGRAPSDEEALANVKRWLDVTEIGDPMTDEEIRTLGYRQTRRGWVPIEAAR